MQHTELKYTYVAIAAGAMVSSVVSIQVNIVYTIAGRHSICTKRLLWIIVRRLLWIVTVDNRWMINLSHRNMKEVFYIFLLKVCGVMSCICLLWSQRLSMHIFVVVSFLFLIVSFLLAYICIYSSNFLSWIIFNKHCNMCSVYVSFAFHHNSSTNVNPALRCTSSNVRCSSLT